MPGRVPYLGTSGGSATAGRTPYLGGGTAGTAATSRTPYLGAAAAPAPKGGGGFLGLGSALNKVEGFARGIVPGVETLGSAVYSDLKGNPKPIAKVAKQVGKNEAKNWGDFAMTGKPNVGIALDALTLASGGAGGVGKLGDALRASGVATDLGKAADLTAPDFAARAGQAGEHVVLRQSNKNPLQKAVQVAVNKGLNRLPHQTPVVGSDARVLKALAKEPQRAGARVTIAAHPSTAAFDKLSIPERAAWHLAGQGVTPAQYKALLLAQDEPASPAMLKLLDNPKVAALVEKPSPRLATALAEGRAASEHLSALKVDAGHISEAAAAESPYRLLRLVNGAKVVKATPAKSGAATPALKASRMRVASLDQRVATSAAGRTRTLPEAQARLSQLEKENNAALDKIAQAQFGTIERREVNQRTRHNLKAGRSSSSGGLYRRTMPTVTNERRAHVEQQVEDAIARNPAHPVSVAWRNRTNEIDQLRTALNPELGQKIVRAQLGHVGVPIDEARHAALTGAAAIARADLQRAENSAASRIEPTGYIDQPGREIPVLAKELADRGKEQPFYIPHSADTGGIRGLYTNKPPAGFAAPAASGASKQNLGILASQGRLAFNQNPLAREFAKFKGFTEAQHLHDAIVHHAAELPDGAALPHGYEFLKINRGEASAPYTQRVGGEFEHGLDPGFVARTFTKDEKDADILRNAEGKRLVVPASVKRLVESRQASVPHTHIGLAYQHMTSIWKHMVLGLRPAFFGNITAGNSILGMLQAAPGTKGFAGWLNQVTPKLEGALGKRVTAETMHEVFPEQAMGTFGHTSGFGGGAVGTSKVARGADRVYQGVMPATIAYENVLRRAMVEGWAKSMPEVKAAMAGHGDVNQALIDVAKTHPQIINNISKRVDDALGDYRNYNKLERQVKNLIPFYGWDRHIVRSTARLARERPGRLNALAKIGQVGQQNNEQTLGPVPSYLQGAIKLPGLPGFMGSSDGRTPLLNWPALSPFNTIADLAKMPGAVTGNAGGAGSETLTSGLNPFIQALIEQATGKSLLSGAAVKGNAFADVFKNLPQVSLARTALGGGAPTKPTSLYKHDWQTQLAAFLGPAIKKTNLQTAHLYAAQEGKPRH